MYCKNCGKEIDDTATFCSYCGDRVQPEEPEYGGLCCPKCGSPDIDFQVHQEHRGTHTVRKTRSKYKEKRHGCMWWLFVGWWWWMIDLYLWIFVFPIRFLFQLFKKKKYVGSSTTHSFAGNKIRYRTVCLCNSCGYHWEK